MISVIKIGMQIFFAEGSRPMKEIENQSILIKNLQIIREEHAYPLSPCVLSDAEKTNQVTELNCEGKMPFE